MTGSTPLERFSEANDLWFWKGYTGRALRIYRSLAEGISSDRSEGEAVNIVAAYQLSQALWSLGAFDEARTWAQKVWIRHESLNSFGRKYLDQWRAEISRNPPIYSFPEYLPQDLDIEVQLWRQAKESLEVDWQAIGLAAVNRNLYGVAVEALIRGRSGHSPDDDHEIEFLRQSASGHRKFLENIVDPPLYRPAPPSERQPVQGKPSAKRRPTSEPPTTASAYLQPRFRDSRNPRAISQRPGLIVPPAAPQSSQPPAAPSSVSPPEAATARPGPLGLVANIVPNPASPVDQVMLLAKLINKSPEPVLVNARLLLAPNNSRPGTGELEVEVVGPMGYTNLVGVHVRSAEPLPKDFRVLRPGEAAERNIPLWRYHSLHLPGTYRLSIRYRNGSTYKSGGLDSWIGSLSAETSLTRLE